MKEGREGYVTSGLINDILGHFCVVVDKVAVCRKY